MERTFLEDAPWDGCEHGNYVEGCHGCWEALVGQADKASQWQGALTEILGVVVDANAELRTLTRKGRDDRQERILDDLKAWVDRVTR